ncbi:MAG TPA: MFS transporter [Mycobacteriales bacterium]|nr:MFS transporter [Mycobacteriales bacterium]
MRSELRRAAIAGGLVFAVSGGTFGVWVGRIPEVQRRLDLSDGALGLTLLALTAAAFVGIRAMPAVVARLGLRATVRASVIAFPATLFAAAVAVAGRSETGLVLALVAFGVTAGLLDGAMNVHGNAVEQRAGRSVINGLHALFSIGALGGSAGVALLATQDVSAPASFGWGAVALIALGFASWPDLLADGVAETPHHERRTNRPKRLVALLAAMCFVGFMTEGATADWSGVLLHRDRHASTALAPLGYVAFNVTMSIGRFAGDHATDRWGRAGVVRTGALLAAASLAVAALLPYPVPAALAFGVLGAGLSIIVPLMFGAAGDIDGDAHGASVADVGSAGYVGIMVGPPLIGGLSELLGLSWALVVPAVLLAGVALVAPRAVPSVPVQQQV